MIHFFSTCCNERVYPIETKEDQEKLRKTVTEAEWKELGPGVKFICSRCRRLQVRLIIKNVKGGR